MSSEPMSDEEYATFLDAAEGRAPKTPLTHHDNGRVMWSSIDATNFFDFVVEVVSKHTNDKEVIRNIAYDLDIVMEGLLFSNAAMIKTLLKIVKDLKEETRGRV